MEEYTFQVRWGDTDAAGIVYYPNFYKWMDEATHEYFKKIGFPSVELYEEQQIGLPLLEAKCQFKSPLRFEDQVVVKSKVNELHNKVFTIQHVFVKEERVIAEGYETRAWTSFKEQAKAQPIPEYIRQKMMPEIKTVES
ncbi:4-hydroxybenzoyl-CoA thioesterase [Bacillus thuringiensis serovar roskildiensis]|uniref:4-hydroxybenzoyl-CoA thioesterase n=1 Tax=Bacillus thuringiensis serovar sooncheon TaxID=180891 RepID=A0A9Q5SLJ5_BACTU|nr:thioesterase family protein [Bacillus thuringiensis]OTW71912.1 4-hydroxybenzoyl-CoA thioesterase [Bacillus thuringiensis serovar coreanensis]OTX55532.1 4-hydroxybenzoyl-CoA thioesterase [Bacillus thuringiensis serovar sooncheon]OTX58869.1 4-hydroxybenzoyl-CoA thioesterase [Bacillus thuringiensis serovar guiyangiensis]OTX72498.1 4-hydroxybenzoyl-CoA thioesterase [Bacillus thuringiensis serovar roskildiensis]